MNTIYWCRGCGFEDTTFHEACGNCGSALATSEVEWLKEGDLGEETVYELEVSTLQRSGLVEALITDGVRHRWDNPEELVVATQDEDAVDRIIDDVLHEEVELVDEAAGSEAETIDSAEDPLDDDLDGDDDGTGDEGYTAMSELFFAADRLLKRWEADDVGNFIADATAFSMHAAPFGVEDEQWADLQSLARNSAQALEDDAEADVEPQVIELRDRLKALI